ALVLSHSCDHHLALPSFPTRRSSDLDGKPREGSCSLGEITVWPSPYGDEPASTLREWHYFLPVAQLEGSSVTRAACSRARRHMRSEEHTSELQSPDHLVCRLLL